ncbi:MAG: VirB8/TrbF family protein [Rhodospirillales bacterium]
MMIRRLIERCRAAPGERIEPTLDRSAMTPASPHGPVVEADPYAFQAAHRRLAWLFRLSVGTNVALAMTAVTMGQTISVLVPLKKTEYALVRTYAPDDKLYRIEPIAEDVEGFELLLESMARRYVKLVLELDPVTQDERMKEASGMTDRAFSERFYRERVKSGAIRDALDRGLTREIVIESVDKIESFGSDHKLVVDFIRVDRERGGDATKKRLRAYLSMTTRPQEVRKEDRFTNPLGIVVLDMTLKERNER